mmetsp:Transcript_7407/g.27040  ORF Transcript_7407/g.27040 Transcript_7407/m.27040 type:complete len:256 (+) Transcript_7407:968-1735(+)
MVESTRSGTSCKPYLSHIASVRKVPATTCVCAMRFIRQCLAFAGSSSVAQHRFGAVSEMSKFGINASLPPSASHPSTFHPDGMSMATVYRARSSASAHAPFVAAVKQFMTSMNGSRTSPLNEKPNNASTKHVTFAAESCEFTCRSSASTTNASSTNSIFVSASHSAFNIAYNALEPGPLGYQTFTFTPSSAARASVTASTSPSPPLFPGPQSTQNILCPSASPARSTTTRPACAPARRINASNDCFSHPTPASKS